MISTADLRAYMGGLPGAEEDSLLRNLEVAAVARVTRATQRFLDAPASGAEIYNGTGRPLLQLRNNPDTGASIVVETRVGDTWSTVTSSGYSVIERSEAESFLLLHSGRWPEGEANVRVTYTRGYAAGQEPPEIREMVKALVADDYVTRAAVVDRSGNTPQRRVTPEDWMAFVKRWKAAEDWPLRLMRAS